MAEPYLHPGAAWCQVSIVPGPQTEKGLSLQGVLERAILCPKPVVDMVAKENLHVQRQHTSA